MYNQATLIGNMATDATLRYTADGTPVAAFRLAVNRTGRIAEGQPSADFFDVVLWGQNALFGHNYLESGRRVLCAGHLRTRQYPHKDGYTVRVVELHAFTFTAMDGPAEGKAKGERSVVPEGGSAEDPQEIPPEVVDLAQDDPSTPYD